MGTLSYRTRENGNPSDRPNVYLAIHPKDYKDCLEEVCKELLDAWDCVVYFADPDAIAEEEFFMDLCRMQLMVIPVTGNLLNGPCRALDIEVPYGKEHHIPLLPLMQEPGLEQRFNDRCQDLHCLSKFDTTPSVTDYPTKLHRYLETVFVTSFKTEYIRSMFTNHIFLSYRKKDRKHAQELMRLIHSIPQYQDVAVWYDEFLIPGENFNDAIRQNLQNSDLFLLTVTPSILEPKNYIEEHEYPEALMAQKPILPVEMLETDIAALRLHYPKIPVPIDCRDLPALEAALAQIPRKTHPSVGSDEHTYYLGLAYLYGVMVECDGDRALNLITKAAENGYANAAEELADMYFVGKGAPRDLQEALKWCRKLVELIEANSDKTTGTMIAASAAYSRLGRIYREIGILSDAIEAYNAYVKYMYNIATTEGTPGTYRAFAQACNELGEVYRQAGDIENAYRSYQQGLHLTKQIAEQLKSLSSRQYYADSCDAMGQMMEYDGKYAEAKELFLIGLEHRIYVEKARNNKESHHALSVSYSNLARICVRLNAYEESIDYAKKAIEIDEELAARERNADALRALLIGHHDLGQSWMHLQDYDQAEVHLIKAMEIAQQLHDAVQGADSARELAISLERLGELYYYKDEDQQSDEYYLGAIQIMKTVVANANNDDARRLLAEVYTQRAYLKHKCQDFTSAIDCLCRALEIIKHVDQGPLHGHLHELPEVLKFLGSIYREVGELHRMVNCLEQEIVAREELESLRNDAKEIHACAMCHLRLGEFYLQMSHLRKAQNHLQQAINLYEGLYEVEPSEQWGRELAGAYEFLGRSQREQEDYRAALDSAMRSGEIRKHIQYSDENVRAKELAISYYQIGDAYMCMGAFAQAKQFHENALDITMRQQVDEQQIERVADSMEKLTHICIQAEDYDDAMDYAKETVQVAQYLAKKYPTPNHYDQLGSSYLTIGMMTENMKAIHEAHRIYTMLNDKYPDNPQFAKKWAMIQQILGE